MKLSPPPRILRVFLSNAKVFWKEWNVQSMLLTSFIIQLVLIFLAPFRKHTSNRVLIGSVWLAYLLADWVAIQAIGLISNPCGSIAASNAGNELYAFWAQFLLLHLGGPDTITALAPEDNELWLRTGLHLAVQIYGGLGILVKSVAHSQTSLWVPTLFMFTAGVIKYTERVSSLFYGRLLKFSAQNLFRKPFVQYWSVDHTEDKPDAELPDPFHEKTCTSYMYKCTPDEAFRVMEIQFNLAYEAFYTKMAFICTKSRWKTLRLVVTLLQVVCLVLWLFFTDKDELKEHNIRITYTLLVGALAVDVFSILRIELWSDWGIAASVINLIHLPRIPSVLSFYNMILSARKRTWGRYSRREDAPLWARFRRALFRRWSESIPQLSLLSLCLEEHYNKVHEFLGFDEGLEQRKYVSRKWFSNDLRDFLHEDLKDKVKTRGGVENIGKVKGGWACHSLMSKYPPEMIAIPFICDFLDIHREYYMILIQWHIITEICYQGVNLSHDNSNATNTIGSGNNINLEEECNYREICKTLSDYLMYLLIHRQDMLSPSAPTDMRLQNTYTHLKYIFIKNPSLGTIQQIPARRGSTRLDLACRFILDDSTKDSPDEVVHCFPIAGILGELEVLERKQIGKWEFMAKVWSELLYYAAINCKPNFHATNLKQGGELLSFVWLLLFHLGFGFHHKKKFRSEKSLLYASSIESCSDPFGN